MKVIFSQHAVQQMFRRSITVNQVKYALSNGEEIKSYPEDKPYPSKLLLVIQNEIPLHIVIAENRENNEIIIITAYIPGQDIWTNDFKSKK
jgi:hypothetical protein